MALITDKEAPDDVPTTNALDNIDTGEDESGTAYLSFGKTPYAIEGAPRQGETRTFLVRAYCKDEHGPLERGDGEIRFERTMIIREVWEQGTKPPGDGNQHALFDRNSFENGDTGDTEGGDE